MNANSLLESARALSGEISAHAQEGAARSMRTGIGPEVWARSWANLAPL
jgi:hypothetical protein